MEDKMFLKKTKPAEEWRDGVFLCTVHDSFQADIIESKLASEGIPCIRKYEGAGNYMPSPQVFLSVETYCSFISFPLVE